jgi:hypothetical protein
VRALRFALALIRRRAARTGPPAPAAPLSVAAQRGAPRVCAWHLHRHCSLLRVEPRLSLTVAVSVTAPPAAAASPAMIAPAAERVREVLAFFRRHDHTRERRSIELHVVRASERLTERCVARAVRIDGERPAAVVVAAAPARVVTAPAVELRLARQAAVAVQPDEPVREPRRLAAALTSPGLAPTAPAPALVAPDVERLADSVLEVIDRRVVAHRERLGRP